MQVFVDRTDVIAANYSVPRAEAYTGALIETTKGIAYFTDIIVTTNQITIYMPRYNMEGYGQGSALVVKLLPSYTTLSATMKLNSWSVPQSNQLSFQINAMNSTGALKNTCRGFFQLGVDLNRNGRIEPWYVPGVNCESTYFDTGKGIATPPNSVFNLTITETPNSIEFLIYDVNTSQLFTQTIPYNGAPFYATYTQLEFQANAKFSISQFQFQGSLFDMHIFTTSSRDDYLGANYMLPFVLDTPPTWNFNYYVTSTTGYNQTST